MLTGLDTLSTSEADSGPYGVGSGYPLAGVAGVANRSARIDRRFEPAVAA